MPFTSRLYNVNYNYCIGVHHNLDFASPVVWIHSDIRSHSPHRSAHVYSRYRSCKIYKLYNTK